VRPIILTQDEFKRRLAAKELRGAGLYELDRSQVYYVDVPKGHPLHRAPYVAVKEKEVGCS
jgi:hypothetical protein